jgi:carbon-monoxide dehydrogenase small subunit
MSRIEITLNVNGTLYPLGIESRRTLLEALREDIGLIGTKPNCREGECGVCTVLVDGRVVNSCIYPAARAAGHEITTIEGLASDDQLHPVQAAFLENGAVQCGYCTPAFILATIALTNDNPQPTDDEVNRALAGNICRCTGYTYIRKSIHSAIKAINQDNAGESA